MMISTCGVVSSQDSISGGGLSLPGWSYGKKVTIPANNIDGDITNFPCTVYLNSTNFDFTKAKADGADIRFTDKNLNMLKFERIEHTSTIAKYNVLIPSVTDLIDTEFYMWYGNVNAYNTSVEAWQDQTGKQLTYNGNVKLIPNRAKFGKAGYFDGSGDYITIPDSTDFDFSAKVFTIEFWFLKPSTPSAAFHGVLDKYSNDSGWHIDLGTSATLGRLRFNCGSAASTYIQSTTNICDGKMRHIAIVGDGTYGKMYIDGVQEGSVMLSPALNNTAHPLYINGDGVSTLVTEFYMDELRISNGVARYSSNFVPPKEPFTVDSYTKLLLHFDDFVMRIATSTTGTDYCQFAKNNIVTGGKTTVLEAKLETETSGTGAHSDLVLFDGTKRYVLDILNGSVRCNSISNLKTTHTVGNSTGPHIYKLIMNGTTNCEFYFDGTLIATTPYANIDTYSQNVIGFGDGSGISGDGGSVLWYYAKYNLDYQANPTNFVEWKPAQGKPSSNGWTLDGTDKATITFKEDAGKIVTLAGDTKPVKTAYADGARAAYFDGAGDYFSFADSEDWNINADFCLELKTNFSVAASTSMYYLAGQYSDSSNYWFLRKSDTTGGQWRFQVVVSGTSRISAEIGSVCPTVGAITDIALVRSGNTYTIYVNGASMGSTTATYAIPNYTNQFILGISPVDRSSAPFNGFMLGARFTKRARYTAAYTPPTSFSIDGSDVVFCTNFDTVYDSSHAMVQHMGISLIDATGNANNGTATGTALVDTAYGKARSFNGSSERIEYSVDGLSVGKTLVSLWKPLWNSSDNVDKNLLTAFASSTNKHHLYSYTNGATVMEYTANGTKAYDTFSAFTAGAFITWGYCLDKASQKTYTDGIATGNSSITGTTAAGTKLIVGCEYDGSSYKAYGNLVCSDLRLENVIRTDAWIKAESLALKNQLITLSDA